MAAAAVDYSFETSALKQAQCLREKVSEASSNGCGGRLGPRGFDWSAPSNTQEKNKKAKKKKKKRSALLEEREASLGLSL